MREMGEKKEKPLRSVLSFCIGLLLIFLGAIAILARINEPLLLVGAIAMAIGFTLTIRVLLSE